MDRDKVMELVKKHEKRDPMELLPEQLPAPIPFESQREFVRKVLAQEVDQEPPRPVRMAASSAA